MTTTGSLVPSLTTLILLIIGTLSQVSGWSSINQSCTPFPEQYNSCDPFAFLFCDTSIPNTYNCKCRSPDFVWAHIVGRCTQRVGSNCYPPGTGSGGSNAPGCPPSAYCDLGTYTCKCNGNFKPNPNGSACNTGTSSMQIGTVLTKGIILVVVTSLWKNMSSL